MFDFILNGATNYSSFNIPHNVCNKNYKEQFVSLLFTFTNTMTVFKERKLVQASGTRIFWPALPPNGSNISVSCQNEVLVSLKHGHDHSVKYLEP